MRPPPRLLTIGRLAVALGLVLFAVRGLDHRDALVLVGAALAGGGWRRPGRPVAARRAFAVRPVIRTRARRRNDRRGSDTLFVRTTSTDGPATDSGC